MFENFKEGIRTSIRPSSTHLAALRNDLKGRVQRFKAKRTPQEQKTLEENFAQVLTAWGIDEQDIPAVLRELRLRLVIFALPVVACAVALMVSGSKAIWLAVALVSLPCTLGMLTACWRISVLSCGRFQPFGLWLGCWLCSFVGFTQKRP